MLGDILFTLAALGFTYSSVPQIFKLRRVQDSTGISYTRHKILFACIVITIVACVHTQLWLSTVMNSVQLGFLIILMYQIKKYRKTTIYGGEKTPKTDKEWHRYWFFTPNKPDDYPHIKLIGDKE